MPIEGQRLPPEKLLDLPEHVREFLSDLRPEEVDQLRESIQFIASMRLAGKVGKWLVISFFAIFMGVFGAINLLQQVFGLHRGGGQ